MNRPDIASLAKGLTQGSRRSLAKALTLIESRRPEDRSRSQELLSLIYPAERQAKRIGISGSPGVGKSTFIEAFGQEFLRHGQRLAILAIDPSSPRSRGSILGDKTRMQELAAHENCFIRPSPAGSSLGGVARRTREAILLCEAAGYDAILIETVGVGQSEHIVSTMVDLFMFLTLPHAGDQLQGIKKGILELADIIVVTKADGAYQQAARRAAVDHEAALHYLRPDPERLEPKVFLCSAQEKSGLDAIFAALQSMFDELQSSGRLLRRRQMQTENWYQTEIYEELMARLMDLSPLRTLLEEMQAKVLAAQLPPPAAAYQLVSQVIERMKS